MSFGRRISSAVDLAKTACLRLFQWAIKSVTRVYVIVEGQTEESFVKGPLAEALWSNHVLLAPIILGVPGQKGGRTNYVRLKKDVVKQLKHDQRSYCTTMVDYYGLGSGFPGVPAPEHFDSLQKVEHIEGAMKDDICRQLSSFRPEIRFIPYLSLHEYESLLFSDPDVFARSIGQPHLARHFQQIRNGFATPEDINDGPESAPFEEHVHNRPGIKRSARRTDEFLGCMAARSRALCASKRVMSVYSRYKKVIEGTGRCEKINQGLGSEKHTELASFSRNTDRVFVKGDTAAAVTLGLISRQPAMSPTGFSDSHRDGSGCVAAFDNRC